MFCLLWFLLFLCFCFVVCGFVGISGVSLLLCMCCGQLCVFVEFSCLFVNLWSFGICGRLFACVLAF